MADLSQISGSPLVTAWVLLVGATIGSFLNVVIARVPHGQSIVRPGSRCPRCGTPIRWYDNVPILSWLLLRARCRACRAPISARYPLVEALGAGLAWLAWHRHGLSAATPAELAFAAALLALAFIDLDTWLLPYAITLPLIAFGLGMSALGVSAAPAFRDSLYGAGLGFAIFAGVSFLGARIFRKEALGLGDVWLLAGLGAWLGVKALLPVILLASLQGSVIGIALILLRREKPGSEQPPAGQPAASQEAQAAPPAPEPLPASPAASPPPSEPAPAEASPEEQDWTPPRHAIPFGPFLVAGALEWLYLSAQLASGFSLLEVFR